jgi:hypothetical protein
MLAGMMNKMCPLYDQLHELLSEKSNVNPPGGNEVGISNPNDGEQEPLLPEGDVEVLEFDFDQIDDDALNHESSQERLNSENSEPSNPPNPHTKPSTTTKPAKLLSSSTETKKSCKQSRVIDAFEFKSKVRAEEVNLEHKKLDFEREKWTLESGWKERGLLLEEAREKHKMEMEAKAADAEVAKQQQQHELEKYKLEKEIELQIKLAKIKNGIDV